MSFSSMIKAAFAVIGVAIAHPAAALPLGNAGAGVEPHARPDLHKVIDVTVSVASDRYGYGYEEDYDPYYAPVYRGHPAYRAAPRFTYVERHYIPPPVVYYPPVYAPPVVVVPRIYAAPVVRTLPRYYYPEPNYAHRGWRNFEPNYVDYDRYVHRSRRFWR